MNRRDFLKRACGLAAVAVAAPAVAVKALQGGSRVNANEVTLLRSYHADCAVIDDVVIPDQYTEEYLERQLRLSKEWDELFASRRELNASDFYSVPGGRIWVS